MGLTGAKARRWLSLAAPLRPFWPLQEAVQCTDALTSPGSMLHPCLPPLSPPCSLESVFPLLAKGQRSATSQAMHQLFGLFVTLIFASVGGSLGGE